MRDLAEMILGAGKEIADSIGLDGCHESSSKNGVPTGLKGAHISLVGDTVKVQLALQASDDAHLVLGRAMLGMEPEDELSFEDAAECVCELTNQLAGCLQRRMVDASGLKIGLPVFVNGDVEPTANLHAVTYELRLGDVPVSLVVVVADRDD